MWILWQILFLVPGIAAPFEFPERIRCALKSDCVAIQGLCQEWEYVHKRHAVRQERKNTDLTLVTPCVGANEVMTDPPEADCFHGICTAKKALQPKTGCAEFRERLDLLFLYGAACDTHAECERGLAHCGEECEFHAYNKEAKAILAAWQNHLAEKCVAPCTRNCIDPLGYLVGRYAARCELRRCVFRELKQIRVRQ